MRKRTAEIVDPLRGGASPFTVRAAANPAVEGAQTGEQYLGKTFHSATHEFTIKHEIAVGGQGSVYTASHNIPDYDPKEVAVKFLEVPKGQSAKSFKKRFQRETQILERLSHPNIVRMLDAGDDNGTLFMAAEYIKGPTLSWMLKRYQELPLDYSRQVLLQICAGLQEAHDKGAVYRDMKPDNILCLDKKPIIREDGPIIKIVDFGLVKFQGRDSGSTTGDGMFVGTAPYMAPEQFDHEGDARADVYSTGILAHQLVTGRLPFSADNLPQYMKMHLQDIPELPSLRAPDRGITDGIDYIIMHALEKDPDNRFGSMAEFAEAIEQYWDWKKNWWQRLDNTTRWWLKAGIVTVAATALLGTAGFIYRDNLRNAYGRYVEPGYQQYVEPKLPGNVTALVPKAGYMARIESTPAGAAVYLKEGTSLKLIGNTPFTSRLYRAGEYVVVYNNARKTVSLSAAHSQATVSFTPKQPPKKQPHASALNNPATSEVPANGATDGNSGWEATTPE